MATHDEAALAEWREAARADAFELGFSLVGFTTADPLDDAEQRRWSRWLAADRAGKMDYLKRVHPRRTHPRDLLPEAESIIVVGAGYYDGDHDEEDNEGGARGKIARYAWGQDYHHVLRERLAELARRIESRAREGEGGMAGEIHWRAFADSAPLDERSLARRAGLGFIGKNTLLLHPEHGSWMLLGELLISIPFPPDESVAGSCGNCRKCLDACPTQAFVGPYELDPRRCISYLTIEQPDPIPEEFAGRLKGWAFGCDICQEVCPYNELPLARLLPELAVGEGFGPYLTEDELDSIPSGKALERRYGHTPLTRPGLKGLKRNLAAAVESGNERGE